MGDLPSMVSASVNTALERNLGTASGTARGPAFPAGYVPIWNSGIKGIFGQHPRTSSETTFPRVVVTLEDAPAWHGQMTPPDIGGRPPGPGCWRFRAKVWSDARSARDIEPFHFCNFDNSRPFPAIDRMAFERWAGMRVRPDLIPTTGDVRNEGPNRPFSAVPRSVHFLSHTTGALGAVAAITGISLVDGDPRLWFNVDIKDAR
jgi:hypothetical protein